MNATVLVRVRWSDSAGCFTAQTMVPVKDRQEASCTYSAEVAAKRAAAKHFQVEGVSPEDHITTLTACKPGTNITAVGKEWAAFEFAPKGSTTQTELFQAGGAS